MTLKKHSQVTKDRISARNKDSWKDPTKRVEQKKRIKAKRLLAAPLNIENIWQSPLDEMKKPDDRRWEIFLDLFIEYFFMRKRRPLRESQNILEKAILIKVLYSVNGKQKDAANFLGINYTTLCEKIKKHNIKYLKTPIGRLILK